MQQFYPTSLLARYLAILTALFFLSTQHLQGQEIQRIDPPGWFTGMPNSQVELLVKGKNLNPSKINVTGQNVSLVSAIAAKNPEYLYVTLNIGEDAPAQTCQISAGKGKKSRYAFNIRSRRPYEADKTGLAPTDLIYLITPDRFADGDTSNDIIPGMEEHVVNRKSPYGRHGGDIQGIENHLGYIKSLGVTTLWINPLLENNEPRASYHGYAITDPYKIDPRFGSNNLYRDFVDSCHQKDLKVIEDVVYNHWGDQNYLIKDLPDSNWIHSWPSFTKTNYRASVLVDPHASEYDKKVFSNGWFDGHMPDLNQSDPHLAKYLIENSLWTIETFHLDAFRIDTYAYCDQTFMSNLNEAIHKAFPHFFIFGETWVQTAQIQGYFPEKSLLRNGIPSHLDAVTDFQLNFAILDALTQKPGWAAGISKVYYTLSGDYIYQHPNNLITFLDNHDIARFYGKIGKDMSKFKQGIGMLLTLRGIPCLYYGTELLMSHTYNDGLYRQDFPGGWASDSTNSFLASGRDSLQNVAFNYIAALANFRKNSTALTTGKLIQFVPHDGLYVYFRQSKDQTVMVALNTSSKVQETEFEMYNEVTSPYKELEDIFSGTKMPFPEKLSIDPGQIHIWKLD